MIDTYKIETMIDIETLDIGPRSIVLSMAAVHFTQDRGPLDHIYVVLDIDVQIVNGRTMSQDTLFFWMHQTNNTARDMAFTSQRDNVVKALDKFIRFFDRDSSPLTVWANSTSFMILDSLFQDMNMRVPWNYRDFRDVRTLLELARGAGLALCRVPDEHVDGSTHDPLSDCRWQIAQVREGRRRLGLYS